MKVVDLINKLNDIGYDENTELTFSFVDRKTGDWHVVSFDNISYGEELTGKPYDKELIDIFVDVDYCEEYKLSVSKNVVDDLIEDINGIVNKYRSY